MCGFNSVLICTPADAYVVFEAFIGAGASGAAFVCRKVTEPTNGVGEPTVEKLAAKVIDVRQLRLIPEWERERDKLKREVGILASICHTGVVNLHGVVDTEDMLVLLMDLVEGGELFGRVSRRTCTEEEARYIIKQVAETLSYLHSEGVLHRDLKLENVLVASEPAVGYFHVKVADFGLSKALVGSLTKAKSYVGTPQYWAPEVIMAGKKKGASYSYAADIWSLGCMLYTMVGGAYPFNCDEDWETEVLAGEVSFGSRHFERVSEECKSLIRQMLKVNIQKRITLPEILAHPWLQKPFGPNVPTLPELKTLKRVPISMNLGPLFIGARGAEAKIETAPSYVPEVTATSTRADVSMLAAYKPTVGGMEVIRNALQLFNANEMLELLTSVFYRFHSAFMVFRSDEQLKNQLQLLLTEIKDLTLATVKVFKRFSMTCGMVKELLEDVTMLVDDGHPEDAVDMFEHLQAWAKDLVTDGAAMRQRYVRALQMATSLLLNARDTRAPEILASIVPNQPLRTQAMLADRERTREVVFEEALKSGNENTMSATELLDFVFVPRPKFSVQPVDSKEVSTVTEDQPMAVEQSVPVEQSMPVEQSVQAEGFPPQSSAIVQPTPVVQPTRDDPMGDDRMRTDIIPVVRNNRTAVTATMNRKMEKGETFVDDCVTCPVRAFFHILMFCSGGTVYPASDIAIEGY